MSGTDKPAEVQFEANVVFVTDTEVASNWYQRVFGMRVVEKRGPEYVHMALGPAQFYIETYSEKRALGFWGVPPGGRTSLVFRIADIRKFVERSRTFGGRVIVEPVQQHWGGWNAIIADPDGNELILDQD